MFLCRGLTMLLLPLFATASTFAFGQEATPDDYDVARWSAIHFSPAIEQAKDEDCLVCHQNILENSVRETSPAGFAKDDAFAWYQALSTYAGEQETFHRRHLVTAYADSVMDLQCNTCHQGNDPREEVSGSSKDTPTTLTMRKQVDPAVCLLCHGQFNFTAMGIPGPWTEHKDTFGNNCLLCHAGIRLERHQGVDFLKAEAIESLGAANADVCFGCHGGRAWYANNFPYITRKWPGHSDVPLGLRDKYTR